MKDNNSPVKSNQSRNFSSKITLANSSSSPKSYSNRDKDNTIPKRDRLIPDQKFSNELIFEKQIKNMNINQSLNIRPKNSGIYLTGIGEVNALRAETFQNELPEYPNLNINISKKNSRKLNPKLSLDSLPYILNNNLYKSNQFAPVFTCCDQELSPKLLNKVYYQQKAKESKYRLCKTVENSKKLIKKPKSPGTIAPIGAKDYIFKTREINRIKYCMNLRVESIKEFNYNIKEQINSIDYTINSLKVYKNNLENNFLNEFLVQLRALNQITLKERLEEEKLRNTLVRIKKEIYNILGRKRRIEMNKYQIEKWLGLLVYIKEKNKIDEKKIQNYINKNYKGKLIIETADEFDEFYKKEEQRNLRLIEKLNITNNEKMNLFKELKQIKQSYSEDKDLIISILEKEKLLTLLKMRNSELLKEKKEALRLQNISEYRETSSSMPPIINDKEKKKPEKKVKINLTVIYNLIQETFNYIYHNDKECLGDSQESLPVINNMMIKSTKALSQMKIIELCYTSLFYYKETHIKGNEILYKKLSDEIEMNHKRIKTEKYKKEEEMKALELYKKLQAKKERIIFKPTHQDNYSSLVYIEKLKREAKKKTKKVKKEIDIFDYLYDLEDDNYVEEENK